jgi:hypothetical protein
LGGFSVVAPNDGANEIFTDADPEDVEVIEIGPNLSRVSLTPILNDPRECILYYGDVF